MTEDETGISVAEVIVALKRRFPILVVVAGAIFGIGIALAIMLPSVYRSQAVILIERQEIPIDLVRSTVTSFAEQRIQVLSQRVLSSSNLSRVMEQFGLYEDLRERETNEDILDTMRSKISLDMVSADVVDPKSGKATEATIAFSLSFENENAQKAQRVVNDLVSSFLNENIKSRTDSAAQTTSFLDDEANLLKEQVRELETEIAAFKDANPKSRPELEGLTREMMNRTELHLSEVDRMIHETSRHRIYLEAELAQLKPVRPDAEPRRASVIEQFIMVEAQLSAAEAAYGDRHPDVIRLRKQAEAIRGSVDPNAARELYEDQNVIAEAKLSEMLERYGAEHPDVTKSRKALDSIKRRLLALPIATEEAPSNPAYVALAARLEASRAQLGSLEIKRVELTNKLESYAESLMLMPDAEAKYRGLNRDYETAVAKYREIAAKQMEARLSQNLETERKGEKFTLIEPPVLPERPAKPNRIAIAVITLMLSLIGGFGSVSIAELLDDSIRGRKSLQEIYEIPPLATIPVIETRGEVGFGRQRAAYATGLLLLVVCILAAIHILFMPLDVVLYAGLRKIGL